MSAFQRRTPASQPALPQGTRLSVYNTQLLTSTGVSSLDGFIGGGLPVGTLLLVKEDQHTRYAQLLLRYFMAQGLAHGHGLLVASADNSPDTLLQCLPPWRDDGHKKESTPTPTSTETEGNSNDNSDQMKIAWRYQHLRKVDASSANTAPSTTGAATFCHKFDITKSIDAAHLTSPHITKVALEANNDEQDPYAQLYAAIAAQIDSEYSSLTVADKASASSPRRILRVAIQSMISPTWPNASPQATFRFLHSLRGLLRYSLGVAMITLPAYLYEAASSLNSAWIRRYEHCADLIIELRSFSEQEQKAMSSDPATAYHGTLHIRRAAGVNTLVATLVKYGHAGENLAFRQKRHGLLVETLHLPPEGGVSERRSTPASKSDTNTKQELKRGKVMRPSMGLGCASSGNNTNNPLDF
ncbi:Elongator complex protein 4 [Syncephalis fuscata]|nr:Elongator complex protein 4 [Syncephalis fuscata]